MRILSEHVRRHTVGVSRYCDAFIVPPKFLQSFSKVPPKFPKSSHTVLPQTRRPMISVLVKNLMRTFRYLRAYLCICCPQHHGKAQTLQQRDKQATSGLSSLSACSEQCSRGGAVTRLVVKVVFKLLFWAKCKK